MPRAKNAKSKLKNRISVLVFLLLVAILAFLVSVKLIGGKETDTDGIFIYEMLEDGTYAVVGVKSLDCESIEIPESHLGAPVSAIGEGAFSACEKLTGIKIPDSVKSVGAYAFSSCNSLEKIDLSTASFIGDAVFESCSSLREIRLGFLEKQIGYLFKENDSLNTSVPDSLKTVEIKGGDICKRAFFSCKGIEEIVLGDAVESIGDEAFRECSGLLSIEIGNGVISLGNGAFYACASLSRIELPGTLEEISEECFSGCMALTEISLPESILHIGESSFSSCHRLEVLNLPSRILTIGKSAFSDCEGISALNLPASLAEIGEGAFSGCLSLNEIVIPGGVTSVGFGAFENCTAVNCITLPFVGRDGGMEDSHFGYIFGGKVPESLVSVTVSRAEILYEGAFSSCDKIKSIILPDCMNKISASAFSGCSALERIDLPKELTSVEEGVFSSCSSLKEVVFGENVEKIEKNAFSDCTALLKFEAPSSLKEIGSCAFKNCTSLIAVTVPEGITRIGRSAFYGCRSLEELNYNAIRIEALDAYDYIFEGAGTVGEGINVRIGAGVEIIPAYLFSSPGANLAPNLVSLSFREGASVREIGAYAFAYTPLSYISIPGSVAVIGDYAFRYCNKLVIDVAVVKKPDGWSQYWNASNCQTNWAENPLVTYSFVTGGTGEIESVSSADFITLPALTKEGFLFLGWCENENLIGVLYQGNYKSDSDITLYAVWQRVQNDGSSFDLAFNLNEGERYTLSASGGLYVYFKFVPSVTGAYTFRSIGGLDTYGILYDSDRNEIKKHDGEWDFQIDAILVAGKTYYLAVKLYSSTETGEFRIIVE